MLVIKAELWPKGNEKLGKELARAYICNDGITSLKTKGELGSYNANFMQPSNSNNSKKIWKNGRAENVNRAKRGVWDILYLCLKSIGMDRRNKDNLGG